MENQHSHDRTTAGTGTMSEGSTGSGGQTPSRGDIEPSSMLDDSTEATAANAAKDTENQVRAALGRAAGSTTQVD